MPITQQMRLVLRILVDHGAAAEHVRLAAASAHGLNSTRYYQLVNALVDDADARAMDLPALAEYAARRAQRRAVRKRRTYAATPPVGDGGLGCEDVP